MSIWPRKCAGCGQRSTKCETPVGVNSWYCDNCSVFAGMFGTNRRLKNIAEEQSRKWKEGPCSHQSFTTEQTTDRATGKRVQISICRNPNCGAEIYRVLI
jgi:hypothetical protein